MRLLCGRFIQRLQDKRWRVLTICLWGEWVEEDEGLGGKVPLGRKAQWSMVRRARAMRKLNKGKMAVGDGLDDESGGAGKGSIQHVEVPSR